MEMKLFNYMLEIDIYKEFFTKTFGCPESYLLKEILHKNNWVS